MLNIIWIVLLVGSVALAVTTGHVKEVVVAATESAAAGFKLLRGKDIRRVVVLGVAHRVPFDGASIADVTHYETPLGLIPLDDHAVARLRRCPVVKNVAAAHPCGIEQRAESGEEPVCQQGAHEGDQGGFRHAKLCRDLKEWSPGNRKSALKLVDEQPGF